MILIRVLLISLICYTSFVTADYNQIRDNNTNINMTKTSSIKSYQEDKKPININFKRLQIKDLIKLTARILGKNILTMDEISGRVNFISNEPIYKDDLINILIYSLESRGYTIIDNGDMLRIVRISSSSKYNLPILTNKSNMNYKQVVTKIFPIKYANVDYISSKVRHFMSSSAKLVTDSETNAIIITDFLDNIKTIENVISIISQDKEKVIEVIELKNIKAQDASATLKNISKTVFNQKIKSELMDILINKNNNSIMIVGKSKNVDFLKKYILNIDKKGSLVQNVVEVIGLKNVESKNVIKTINSIISKKSYLDTKSKPFASSDDDSNSIIIMGPKDEVDYIGKLIEKLDTDRLQVYVQAKIIEVSENRVKNIGIKYGFEGGYAGTNGLYSLASNLGGTSMPSSTIASLVNMPSNVKKGIIFGASLNLLKNNRAIDIVSEPSILAINNKESSIYVGETKSFDTGSTTTSTGTTSNIQREDIGLKLKVKPRISNKNKVILEIETVIEDASTTNVGAGGNPDTTKKEITTTAIVNDGESIVLGGLVKNKTTNVEEKVPFFGDLPIIGSLFRNNKDENDKINLIIVITPYIIPTSKDLTYIRTKLNELKVLEDKYTKDLEIRLEQRKLNIAKNKLKRTKNMQDIKNKLEDIKEEQEDFEEDEMDN